MVRYCSVPSCKGKWGEPGIRFHQFPKNKRLREAWCINLKMGKVPSETMVVCSKHFNSDDYMPRKLTHIKDLRVNPRLKQDVIPTVNLPESSPYRIPNKIFQRDRHLTREKRQKWCSTIYTHIGSPSHDDVIADIQPTIEEGTIEDIPVANHLHEEDIKVHRILQQGVVPSLNLPNSSHQRSPNETLVKDRRLRCERRKAQKAIRSTGNKNGTSADEAEALIPNGSSTLQPWDQPSYEKSHSPNAENGDMVQSTQVQVKIEPVEEEEADLWPESDSGEINECLLCNERFPSKPELELHLEQGGCGAQNSERDLPDDGNPTMQSKGFCHGVVQRKPPISNCRDVTCGGDRDSAHGSVCSPCDATSVVNKAWSGPHRVFAVEQYIKNGESVVQAQRDFCRHFNIGRHGRVPSRSTILRWVHTYQDNLGNKTITSRTKTLSNKLQFILPNLYSTLCNSRNDP